MTHYQARATREGRYWLIRFPGHGWVTQARNVGELELMARECAALNAGEALDAVQVHVTINAAGVPDVRAAVEVIREARGVATAIELNASSAAARLAELLAESGVTMRDIGMVLDVSFQRAQQLAKVGPTMGGDLPELLRRLERVEAQGQARNR